VPSISPGALEAQKNKVKHFQCGHVFEELGLVLKHIFKLVSQNTLRMLLGGAKREEDKTRTHRQGDTDRQKQTDRSRQDKARDKHRQEQTRRDKKRQEGFRV
jgi:hypothetical protein